MAHPCEDCNKVLPEQKAPDAMNTIKMTPIFAAIRNHHIDCLKSIIKHGADLNEKQDLVPIYYETPGMAPPMDPTVWNFITPLLWVTEQKKVDCAEILVEAGADVNLADNAGYTPLVQAATTWNRDFQSAPALVDLLLKAGADANASTTRGSTCTALSQAAHFGCKENMRSLIGAGADVNLRSKETSAGSTTPLNDATYTHNFECIPILIEAGADINCTSNLLGRTPLAQVAERKEEKYVKWFLQLGADPNIADKYLTTALMAACYEGVPGSVSCLLESGADVNQIDKQHQTALFKAVEMPYRYSQLEVKRKILKLQLLLKSDINVNKFDSDGNNALMYHLTMLEDIEKEICILLFAAGETLIGPNKDKPNSQVPGYLKELLDPLYLGLKNMCRLVIRSHLINLNLNRNLFLRIPELNLPASLASYLLYNQSLTETSQLELEVEELEKLQKLELEKANQTS